MSQPLEQTVVGLQHILLLFSTDGVKLEKKKATAYCRSGLYILSKRNNSKNA